MFWSFHKHNNRCHQHIMSSGIHNAARGFESKYSYLWNVTTRSNDWFSIPQMRIEFLCLKFSGCESLIKMAATLKKNTPTTIIQSRNPRWLVFSIVTQYMNLIVLDEICNLVVNYQYLFKIFFSYIRKK